MADPMSKTQTWLSRIKRAEKIHEEWSNRFRIDKARRYFEGFQNDSGVPDSEWITINKIYSILNVKLPSLYSIDPFFFIKLKRSFRVDSESIVFFEQRAKIRQSYLNYLKEEIGLKEKARMAIQDAHFAYGVIKVGFSADIVEDKESKGELVPVNEKYTLKRIHPDDFIFGEDSGTLPESWDFVAERLRMTRESALDNPLLKNSVVKKLAPQDDGLSFGPKSRRKSQRQAIGFDAEHSKDSDVLFFWEVYDLRKKKWFIIADDMDETNTGFVKEPEDIPGWIEGYPYAVLRFNLTDDSPYPIPPVSQLLDPQRELNLARSKIQTHRKRFNRKYEVFEDGLAGDREIEIQKLEAGGDGTVIRKLTPGQVTTAITDAPMDPQLYTEILALNNDLNEIAGSSPEQLGLPNAQSATQASLIDSRLEVREGDRLSIVVDWVILIAKRLDQTVQAHITRDEAIKVVGQGGEFWEVVKAVDFEDIQGEFQYSVNIGASQPRIPTIERSQWLAFLQVLSSFPQLLLSPRLIKSMAEMHGIEDESLVQELLSIGQQMMSGQIPGAEGAGSQRNVPENNPIAAILGQALGATQGGR